MVNARVVVRYVGTVNDTGIPEDVARLRTIAGGSTGWFERGLLEAIATRCKDPSPRITVSGGAKPWKPRTTPSTHFPPADPK